MLSSIAPHQFKRRSFLFFVFTASESVGEGRIAAGSSAAGINAVVGEMRGGDKRAHRRRDSGRARLLRDALNWPRRARVKGRALCHRRVSLIAFALYHPARSHARTQETCCG
jgi:hypothetical protein